jgi:hypothetical protein
VKSEAVTGPMTGQKLKSIPSKVTTWKRWKTLHPDGLVLSRKTGHSRDYTLDPYRDYFRSPLAFLGFRGKSPGLPEKELVLAVEIGDQKKAYPLSILKSAPTPVHDVISGEAIRIFYDHASESAYATMEDNTPLSALVTYWFVWYGFYPETEIYKKIN